MEVNILLLIAVVVLMPVIFIVASMCSYFGKVWAMRILFKEKGEDRNGKEKR